MDNTEINFDTYYYNDQQIKIFYTLFRECSKFFGCYYMGYIFEDLLTKTRVGFNTNPDWQREYISNHLVDICHLWREVANYYTSTDKQHLILPWAMVKPETSKQKEIILYREEMGIGQNGISFCTKNNRLREYLYFAPEKKENCFLKYVSLNIPLIKKCCRQFRESSRNHQINIKTIYNPMFNIVGGKPNECRSHN